MGKKHKIIDNRALRLLLITLGLCSTALAVVGIFVPLLPTVPLLLLAAACFARSSENFHNWLLEHPQLGPMVRDYLSGQGIPLRAKITAIALVWASISISVLFLIPLLWVKVFLIGIGLCVSIYLLRLPLCEREDS
jgi:uncharacterized membrane protein YbaN (DUF454 family)